jgi:hypothetical protein
VDLVAGHDDHQAYSRTDLQEDVDLIFDQHLRRA